MYRPGKRTREGARCRGSSPGCGKQRVLSPHQPPHLHSDVAELVAQQATEAHEGGGVLMIFSASDTTWLHWAGDLED